MQFFRKHPYLTALLPALALAYFALSHPPLDNPLPPIEAKIDLLESILSQWKARLGNDFEGYKNHCYRMLHFCFFFLPNATQDDRKKLIIAAAHHDIGIWETEAPNVDYLPPSVKAAKEYCHKHNLDHWAKEIELIVDLHHKLIPYSGTESPLIELFRKADLVDFSLGLVTNGVPASFISQVKAQFPNAGFHLRLVELTWGQLKTNPFNPAPMMKL